MNIQWNTVTWYSKLGALLFFLIIFPMIAFGVGREYQKTIQFLAQYEASAQSPTLNTPKKQYSGIRGIAKPQALIAIKNAQGQYSETVSDTDGSFIIFLTPGTYTLEYGGQGTNVEVMYGSIRTVSLTQG